jgi:hypothetical protein
MSDMTDQFTVSKYSDGSWSVESVFTKTKEKKEAFGVLAIQDVLDNLSGGGQNRG